MYALCVKVDENLPWIELRGKYQTGKEAKEAAKKFMRNIKIKIMKTSESKKKLKSPVNAKIIR